MTRGLLQGLEGGKGSADADGAVAGLDTPDPAFLVDHKRDAVRDASVFSSTPY